MLTKEEIDALDLIGSKERQLNEIVAWLKARGLWNEWLEYQRTKNDLA